MRTKNFLCVAIFFLIVSGLNAQNNAIIIEAENAGEIGSDFEVKTEGEVAYLTPSTDFAASFSPGTNDKIITFSIPFPEAGEYDLYVKVRVGENTFDDDSFFAGNGFGTKSSTVDSDWYVVNNIADIGHVSPGDVVTGAGTAGNLVWKWINISEFLDGETPATYTATTGMTDFIFQIGSRENGLDIDKIAFGKSDLFYTVENLENGEAGSENLPGQPAYPDDAYRLVKTFMNPILPGDHPDLTLLKVGDDFYACNSSFHFTPYLAIMHSTDLVHWEEISRVIPPDWPALISGDPKQGIWQGAITRFYNSYWIYFSNTAGGGQYFSKADSPWGPWSVPIQMNTTAETGASGYDNSVFVDDDGTPYLHIKPGRNTNRIQEIGTDGHLTGPVINLDWVNADNQYSWAEGPVMCKRNGWYYYFIAGNVGGGQYVLRSQTLTDNPDSWEALGDFFAPITDPATPFRGPNHITQPFQLDDGTWWTLSHGYENLPGDSWGGKGRQGLLHQVVWDENGKPTGLAPTVSPLMKPELPKSGIAWKLPRSDYFDNNELGVHWYFLNPEAAGYYSLTDRPGWLRIDPASGRSHILQKDAGRYYSLVTRVSIDADTEGQEGGFYLTNGNESVNIRLFSGYDEGKKITFTFANEQRQVDNTVGNTIWLKVERKGHELYGYFGSDGLSWSPVGNAINAADLDRNQENDNWWVGNSHGLYAEGIPAEFDFYFYRHGASDLPVACSENYFGIEIAEKSIGKAAAAATDKGGWLMLGGVELGKGARAPRTVEVVAASETGGRLEIWADDIQNDGQLIATVDIPATGGAGQWARFSANISDVTGQRDVYLRFPEEANALFVHAVRFLPDPTLTSVTELQKYGLSVYPNPFKESVSVDVNAVAQFMVFDLSGRMVESGRITPYNRTIGRTLAPGAYLLNIKTPDRQVTVKIIKVQ